MVKEGGKRWVTRGGEDKKEKEGKNGRGPGGEEQTFGCSLEISRNNNNRLKDKKKL